MRNLFLLFLPGLFFTLFATAYVQGAFAHGAPPSSRQTSNSQQDQSQKSRGNRNAPERVVNQVGSGNTYMVVDADNNRVKVIVEGKEVAYFHKDGLHVEGAITTSTPSTKSGVR